MCAAAIHWARFDAVVFGAGIEDARDAGFNELVLACAAFLQQARSPIRVFANVLRDECSQLFELWKQGPNPTPY